MVVVLSGGGTAGHINPALALAEELASRGAQVHFAGTPSGLESRLAPAAGLSYRAFEASGFDRAHPASLVKGVLKIERSTRAAKRWFDEIKPDVVVGFGGYVSIPVAHAAEQRGIPVVIHEQNSVMGMANRYLAKKAAAICLTYEVAAEALSSRERARVEVTGNPVRAQVMEASRDAGREMLGIPADGRMLLAFGGSQGAHSINQAMVGMRRELLAREGLYVVHITGPKELESVEQALDLAPEERKRWNAIGYEDRMGDVLAAADMILSRAGATSLAEISAHAVPAVLVPFPYATADHQTTNARAYVDAGCASLLADADLLEDDGSPSDAFREALLSLVDDPQACDAMAAAARAQETGQAAGKLAEVVCRVAG